MMSKASFLMQEHLRYGYSLLTEIRTPSSFMVRGRLPYPSGLTAISVLFHNKKPADVYAHPYFIEKQSNPDQPSPQMHITEESQSIMKVMSGLRYMKDENSKLDNTIYFCTDFEVPVEGRVLKYHDENEEKEKKKREALRREREKEWKEKQASEEEEEGKKKKDASDLAKRYQSRADAFVAQLKEESLIKMGKTPATSAAGVGVEIPSSSSDTSSSSSFSSSGSKLGTSRVAIPGATTFPGPVDAADPSHTARFFHTALKMSQSNEIQMSHDWKAPGSDSERPATQIRNEKGFYTVLYNPIEVNELTFVSTVRRLSRESAVVKAIVVPTRTSWEHLQTWADAFPDAIIYAAGPIPVAADTASSSPEPTPTNPSSTEAGGGERRGLKDMGGGVCGIEFPEVDFEEEKKKEELSSENETRLRQEMRRAVRQAQSGGGGPVDAEEDPVDRLWEDASCLKEPGAELKSGVRAADQHRVRLLDDLLAATPSPDNAVLLTPTIELLQVPGDRVANEYVLYDATSKTLACRELFHGAYNDLDPVNSWFCRVWFKFMKKGDHKRVDLCPRFKYLQVVGQDGLPLLRRWVDWLTQNRDIQHLVFSHGTPPLAEGGVNQLRQQWQLPPLWLRQEAPARRESAASAVPPPSKKREVEATKESSPREKREKPDLSWLYKSY